MSIFAYYLLALVPLLVGGCLWWRSRQIVWQEWALGSLAAFALSGLVHLLVIEATTSDVETWSGEVEFGTFHPSWVEEYTVTHSSGSGKNRTTWETKHYTTHNEFWDVTTTLGDTHEITEEFFHELQQRFGAAHLEKEWAYKSGFYSGDHHIYRAKNLTGYVYPTTTLRRWTNKVKSSPSLFKFDTPPADAPIFPWPVNQDWRQSDRLLGTAAILFDLTEFDRLNSRLGPAKHVNLVFVGWEAGSHELAGYQEAAWCGGKKNDLVVCFGGMTAEKPAAWVRVFGWTEADLCKRNLETLFLNQPPSELLLSQVEREVRQHYQLKDWSKFDYLSVEPPGWVFWLLLLVMASTQTGLWLAFHKNDWRDGGRVLRPWPRTNQWPIRWPIRWPRR